MHVEQHATWRNTMRGHHVCQVLGNSGNRKMNVSDSSLSEQLSASEGTVKGAGEEKGIGKIVCSVLSFTSAWQLVHTHIDRR
jgi:hypothetical protein